MTTFPSGALLKGEVHPDTEAVAVLLHGASVGSSGSTSWYTPAPMRMQLFAPAIRTRSRGRIAVLRLRHPDRDFRSVFKGALGDTAALLSHVQRIAPRARVGLVGHSNGGRVALKLSSDSRVSAVAALAPWIASWDRFTPRPGAPVLLMHGALDTITEPAKTEELATRLRARGCTVDSEIVAAENHYLVARASYWHRRVGSFLAEHLLDGAG